MGKGKKKTGLTFFSKNLIFSISGIVLACMIMSVISYVVMSRALTGSLEVQAKGIATLWKNRFEVEDLKKGKATPSLDSTVQKKLVSLLDELSKGNANVAQGFIFEPDVVEGAKTRVISNPTHLLEVGLKPGVLFDQPPEMVKAFQTLKQTKSPVIPPIYKDEIGSWLTVLVPVLDEQQQLVAAFGIDVNASVISEQQYKLIWSLVTASMLFLLVGVTIQIFGLKKLLRPIQELISGVGKISKGDLTQKVVVRSNDELGQLSESFNEMVQSLHSTLEQVQVTVEQVASSSEQLSVSAEDSTKSSMQTTAIVQELATGTEIQAGNIDQTNRAINDISTRVGQIESNSRVVMDKVIIATNRATEGNQAIDMVVRQMNSISSTVNQSAESMKYLVDNALHIGRIVEVINTIANQTNMLALNASIEASRAGEHGRGFAVVAGEVRKLAEQSSNSAQQITSYVESIQDGIQNAVQSMEQGTKEVNEGLHLVNQAGSSFNEIRNAVDEVSLNIEVVSTALEEMTSRVSEVLTSMNRILDVTNEVVGGTQNIAASTEQQLASMEEITSSANVLSSMAEELQEKTTQFKL
ncbi:HAMP domain-containing protein [Paenibacillus chitinolyticus]|uniref:HAMP domain-containing protein n=1 Tax=Paenibacillus chitinolyticus TaxID=79263 RepID=A0A410WST8_9BACL|nr:methyl-accepting chemotaxis protein [Paenibacillus chitinolyticus]MCY9588793.1 methyl-accepting chemotaxis protein [Paenibacillus chitinolyticus]MCY9595703.1 methyl-accepting chemotaxis protein [Paenibacillus chitinolyticus]QAV17459.1 HAMP domain-containing protein [Paenibacillus chitinolyticus]